MPPIVAVALTLILVAGLYVWDSRRKNDSSAALWLPVMWLLVTGSRFPSQWLQLGNPAATHNMADGSPLDAAYFAALIFLGTIVLIRRRVLTGDLIRQNIWIFAFLVYGLISVLWSDFAFVAFKRWIKTLGHPVMALIILTTPNPGKALGTVVKRCAFFLLPMCVVFIKYFPEYGRAFDAFTGAGVYRGIMLTKNDVGYVCMLFGLFFVWRMLSRHSIADPLERRDEVLVSLGVLAMIAWLLALVDSATAIATFAVGSAVLVGLGTRFASRRLLGTQIVVIALVAISVELVFDVYASVVALLGRDPSLTDRTEVWADALALQSKPLLGMGFESFWLGSRLDAMWEKWWWRPNQAHNGYIETYLNLGLIGVLLLAGIVISAFRRIAANMQTDFEFSRLRMALFLAILAQNYTEATFKGVHLVWTIFHIAVLNVSGPGKVSEKARSPYLKPVRRKQLAAGNGQTGFDVAATHGTTTAPHRPRMR